MPTASLALFLAVEPPELRRRQYFLLARLTQRSSKRARWQQLPYDLLAIWLLGLLLGGGFALLGLVLLKEALARNPLPAPLPGVLVLTGDPQLWMLPWQISFRAEDHWGRRMRVVLYADQLDRRDYARVRRLLHWLARSGSAALPPPFTDL